MNLLFWLFSIFPELQFTELDSSLGLHFFNEGRKTKIQTWTHQYRSCEPTTCKVFQRLLPTFAHLYQKDAYPEGHSFLVPNTTSGRGRASLTMGCVRCPPLRENECFLWNFHTK